jgi:lipid II:glycine glycyltransferase (peptidoglycan interpeptide bridge formation enzyme)
MPVSDYVFTPSDFSERQWTSLVDTSSEYNLLQTWAYGAAKEVSGPWKAVRGTVTCEGLKIGAAQVMVRNLPVLRGGLAWLNRGPMILAEAKNTADTLGRVVLILEMIRAIRSHFVEEQKLYLRIAPSLFQNELELSTLDKLSMKPTDTLGWASAKLDLSCSDSDIRKALNGKWRGHLSKAERSGLTVRNGCDKALFQEFSQLHTKMVQDKNLSTNLNAAFFETLQNLMPDEQKMEMFVVMDGPTILGSTLIAKYGSSCEYLATTTTPEGRRKNAGQLLLWAAILEMKTQGYKNLDLSGVDPEQTPKGILAFKQGVNAVPYRLAQELDTTDGGFLSHLVKWKVQQSRLQG